MRYFCTYFDSNYLTRGLALHQSLMAHAGAFDLVVLCMDAPTEATLRKKALPNVRLLPIAELTAAYPRLAAAQSDRSQLEFYFTCAAWLLLHRLNTIPPGELLTYLDADLFFFSSPDAIFTEIGQASVAVSPHRFPASLAHLERYGKFNAGWVSFRRDAIGLACATDWAEKCATWCLNLHEPNRYANQKYVDNWPAQFPGTVSLAHPGANVAPWNIKHASIAASPAGVTINGRPLIFYHFHALTHLGGQLYDPYLDRYDAVLTPELRAHVYLPYLSALHAHESAGARPADLIPLVNADDPRGAVAMRHLVVRLQEAELDRAKRLESVENSLAATAQTIEYLRRVEQDRDRARAEHEQTIAYLRDVEKDSADRLVSIHNYQDKLKSAYADLDRNLTYLKLLEAEIAAHVKVSADKDAIIAQLAAGVNGKDAQGHR